jgi:hypothetical protein
MRSHLNAARAPMKFGPAEGPAFFARHGWTPADVRPLLQTAAKLGRLSLWMRLLALLPPSAGKNGERPWSAVCLLEKTSRPSS